MNDIVVINTMNHDQDRRDDLLGFDHNWNPGAARRFISIDVDTVAALITEGFLVPDDTQDDSPSAGEFFGFMQRHAGTTAHGYAVEKSRDDYRVSIEGINVPAECITRECAVEFLDMCRLADEFIVTPNLFCWYD